MRLSSVVQLMVSAKGLLTKMVVGQMTRPSGSRPNECLPNECWPNDVEDFDTDSRAQVWLKNSLSSFFSSLESDVVVFLSSTSTSASFFVDSFDETFGFSSFLSDTFDSSLASDSFLCFSSLARLSGRSLFALSWVYFGHCIVLSLDWTVPTQYHQGIFSLFYQSANGLYNIWPPDKFAAVLW